MNECRKGNPVLFDPPALPLRRRLNSCRPEFVSPCHRHNRAAGNWPLIKEKNSSTGYDTIVMFQFGCMSAFTVNPGSIL
jgi:hypothetical protein